MSKNHIDVEISVDGKDKWRLTGMYGEPERHQRRRTWELLRNLARDSNLPWCIIGDLNNVLAQQDKVGGAPYPNWLVEGFNEVVRDIGVFDLELIGHQYTWERGRGTDGWTEVRLDRALTIESWLHLFPNAKLYNMEGASSDHSPILLIPEDRVKFVGQKIFRFENAWLTEPMCRQLVVECWEGEDGIDIQEKIKNCGDSLSQWGKEITGKFSDRIRGCKLEMKKLRKRRDEFSV